MFQFGYAQEIITPSVGVGLSGYFNKRPNKGMYDDLYVKVIVIESAGTRFGFMTFDLLGYSGELIEEVEKRIVEKFGRELFESIIICADHTHTGPEYGDPGEADDRIRCAGTKGVIEVMGGKVHLITAEGDTYIEPVEPPQSLFEDFIGGLRGSNPLPATTEDTIALTKACLLARESADKHTTEYFD